MWDLCIEFDMDKQEWYNGPFLKLGFTVLEKKIDAYLKQSVKNIKLFTELEEERNFFLILLIKDALKIGT